MKLADQVIVITGANSGLGFALADVLVKRRGNVVMSDRPGSHPEQEHLIGATTIPADVTDESQVQALADATVSRFGKIDLWINNAGIWMPYTAFEDVPVERARRIMDVNYFGVWHGSQAAYRQMLKQGGGAILNILSIRVQEPVAQTAAYSSSKFAAHALTQVLRSEAAAHNIKVLAAMPERIRTHLFDEQRPVDHDSFMDPTAVATRIADWLEQDAPTLDLVITHESVLG
ncbi:MAG: SDR family oxidoreductase [Candidatus Kerfeldbacteria bacterium]|nr:SDR family oxidoreductase [Candidatus Kerfeldbacteria bacterium]